MGEQQRRPEVGHHLHHTRIGHQVIVRTPGDVPHSGMLVSVGEDRLVLAGSTGVVAVTRLWTTNLELVD